MERGILFSAPMVKALLAGDKTQTRRVMAPQPEHLQRHEYRGKIFYEGEHRMWCWRDLVLENIWDFPNSSDLRELAARCPYGKPGDLLWVRETWSDVSGTAPGQQCALHRATYRGHSGIAWRPSLFMPKWATRIWLEITDVRVERLNEISEEDAKAEGVEPNPYADIGPDGEPRSESIAYRSAFHDLWEVINSGRGHGWSSNPWCWVVSFKRVEKPVEVAA